MGAMTFIMQGEYTWNKVDCEAAWERGHPGRLKERL
jgi:hypothetical protein